MNSFIAIHDDSATIRIDRAHAGLTSAVVLPSGGMLAIDVFRPAFPLRLWVGEQHLRDAAVQQVVRAFADGATESLSESLPDAWTRLAVVNGIDRWFADGLDAVRSGQLPRLAGEHILAVDRALALRDLGDGPAAAALLTPEVRETVSDLLNDYELPQQVRNALSKAATILQLDVRDWVELGGYLWRGLDEDEDSDSEFEMITESFGDTPSGVPVDPTHVAARVLHSEVHVELLPSGRDVQAIGWGFPDITASSIWADRLMLRLVRKADLAAIMTVPFTLSPSGGGTEFQAEVSLGTNTFDEVTVDVFDRHALCHPRSSSDINLSVACQRAYTHGRRALAFQAIEESTHAQRQFALAVGALDGLTYEFAASYRADLLTADAASRAESFAADSPFAYRVVGPTRPTIAELILAYEEIA